MDVDRCTEVQGLISSTFDGVKPDPDALESAKAHCRECTQCMKFVSLLAEVRKLPAPGIPADVLERTLQVVRAEIAASAPAPAGKAEDSAADGPGTGPLAASSVADASESPAATETPTAPPPPRAQWRAWAPWAAAAAVFFIAAGIVTTQGVRYLLRPDTAIMTASDGLVIDGSESPTADTPAEGTGDDSAGKSADSRSADLVAPIDGPAYVTVAGSVYAYDSALEGPPAGPSTGTLTSALDSGGVAVQRDIYAEPGSDTILITGDEESYLRFTPVVRTLRGQPYAMRAQPVVAFGVWPSLPDGIPRPSSAEGTPELVPAGTDDAGVQVFVRPGTDAASGFAIAPGTSASDPAAGNPDWTWWEPAAR